ncbi:hypothetical protein T01_3298 [Trichinella spiralis]|uniref:Uncharacterized protein n=1 Tax=Trichinella spiralis TaxID=6334 RepID=A0A0V1B5L7_TRISP|nr:hypothetical protein T01_3298 [Trichinella spiralis]
MEKLNCMHFSSDHQTLIMKFDGFRHPREQVAPITLAGTFRNQPLRLLFYRNPFLGLFFTIGFILLPYVGHQLDKKGKFILSVLTLHFEK